MRKPGRLVAVELICIMLWGMCITSSAADLVVPPGHECAYSYMGINEYQGYDGGTHPYYVTDAQGNTQMKSCQVTVLLRRKVLKCACGKIKYESVPTIQRHSACGKGDCES